MTYKNNLDDWAEVTGIIRGHADIVKPFNFKALGPDSWDELSRPVMVDFVDSLFECARRARCCYEWDANPNNKGRCHKWEPKLIRELNRLTAVGREWFGVSISVQYGRLYVNTIPGDREQITELATLEA